MIFNKYHIKLMGNLNQNQNRFIIVEFFLTELVHYSTHNQSLNVKYQSHKIGKE